MAWKDLDKELAELFEQDTWVANLRTVTNERLYLYERIKKYLQTPKGKAALARYQSQPQVKERRRILQQARRAAARAHKSTPKSAPKSTKERSAKWYAKHREEINARRRARYKETNGKKR